MRAWVLLLGMACGSAAAQSRAVVAALDDCQGGPATRELVAFREALSARMPAQVLTAGEAVEPWGEARMSLLDVRARLRAAREKLFEPAEASATARLLEEALAQLRALPPTEATWEAIVEGSSLLAWLHQREGRGTKAEETLRRVLVVAPDYAADANLYPPSFRAWVDGARQRLARERRARLQIATVPPGGKASMEGRLVGPAPVALEVPPGAYRLEPAFPDARGMPEEVKVSGERQVTLDRTRLGAVFPERGPCIETDGQGESRTQALLRLAERTRVEVGVGLFVEESAEGEPTLAVSVADVRSGLEHRQARIRLTDGLLPRGALEKLAEFAATGEVAPPLLSVVTGPKVAGEMRRAHARPSLKLRRAAWAAAGLSALTAGGAAIFYLQHQRAQVQLRGMRTEEGFIGDEAHFESVARRLRSTQDRGIVSASIAAASAGAAVVLFLISRPPDGADGFALARF